MDILDMFIIDKYSSYMTPIYYIVVSHKNYPNVDGEIQVQFITELSSRAKDNIFHLYSKLIYVLLAIH